MTQQAVDPNELTKSIMFGFGQLTQNVSNISDRLQKLEDSISELQRTTIELKTDVAVHQEKTKLLDELSEECSNLSGVLTQLELCITETKSGSINDLSHGLQDAVDQITSMSASVSALKSDIEDVSTRVTTYDNSKEFTDKLRKLLIGLLVFVSSTVIPIIYFLKGE